MQIHDFSPDDRRFPERPRRSSGSSRRRQTCPRCPQDAPNPSVPGQAYCRPCKNAYMRDARADERASHAALLAELTALRAQVGRA